MPKKIARALAVSTALFAFDAPAAISTPQGGFQQSLAVLAAPVGYEAGVQALPAQDGALLALFGTAVVLGQDGELVVGAKDPPDRVVVQGPATAVGRHPIVHMPSIGLVDRCSRFAHC